MTSVPTLREAAKTLVDTPQVLVDLGDVKRMDSAGLALLLDWQGQARGRRTALCFRNLPAGIAAIAEVYGLGALLPAEAFGTREPVPRTSAGRGPSDPLA